MESNIGDDNIVRYIIDKGEKVNSQNGRFCNSLCAASVGGHENIVQLLLDRGANINAPDRDDSNALQVSLERGRHKVAESC